MSACYAVDKTTSIELLEEVGFEKKVLAKNHTLMEKVISGTRFKYGLLLSADLVISVTLKHKVRYSTNKAIATMQVARPLLKRKRYYYDKRRSDPNWKEYYGWAGNRISWYPVPYTRAEFAKDELEMGLFKLAAWVNRVEEG